MQKINVRHEKVIFTYWLPNSDATNRKPVLRTHILEATGTVSKYFSLTSFTISSSVSMVTLKISPCSVWTRKKNMAFVLCEAEQTKSIPRSGSSRSFCNRQVIVSHILRFDKRWLLEAYSRITTISHVEIQRCKRFHFSRHFTTRRTQKSKWRYQGQDC